MVVQVLCVVITLPFVFLPCNCNFYGKHCLRGPRDPLSEKLKEDCSITNWSKWKDHNYLDVSQERLSSKRSKVTLNLLFLSRSIKLTSMGKKKVSPCHLYDCNIYMA
ncbi:hypothetical protein XENOCAPTIV_014884 [Xenoophorus captivus]|uniref:Secreted protein n=1 Tax=Xenoophorus captivus TaxID=1517983 RepID=A0ABV0R1U7_9TELE